MRDSSKKNLVSPNLDVTQLGFCVSYPHRLLSVVTLLCIYHAVSTEDKSGGDVAKDNKTCTGESSSGA